MTFRWRIRQKLMLGAGLVVGVIVLLLAGTLYGLTAYRTTMKSFFSKLVDLKEAEELRAAIKRIEASADSSRSDELPRLLEAVAAARVKLQKYEDRLNDPAEHGRDPDLGYIEHTYVDAMREKFDTIERAAQRMKGAAFVEAFKGDRSIIEVDPEIKRSIDASSATSTDLIGAIYETYRRISDEARDHYQTSLWAVSLVSVGGVLLLVTLLRLFYRWLFVPIQALGAGAGRLALGDFDHAIQVHSGDELEDLANGFNNMTARLRDMYGDLARQVNERSRELVRSERLVSVGFLAAGVSHEINNPLASIAFCSEALEARLAHVLASTTAFKGDDREVIAKYLKMIQQEAFRCKSITQRLLEFSRGGERSREPTDLAEIVQSVLDVVDHLENRRGKDIRFNPDTQVTAWVNAQEIKSVVLNLVVNALDSMDEGGTLHINLMEREGQAALQFTDSGCGMSPEVLENIFEPFYTRSRTGKGTGLGLSISHRIISSHGGEIEAVSAGPGHGSTFTVRLPLKPAESSKEESLGHAAA